MLQKILAPGFALLSVACAGHGAQGPAVPANTAEAGGSEPAAAPAPAQAPGAVPSQSATWTCAGDACPRGPSFSGHAIVWPARAAPSETGFGYSATADVYLPGALAKGLTIALASGTATAYAGPRDAPSPRKLAVIVARQPYQVVGVGPNELLSVEGESAFTYATTLPAGDSDAPLVFQSVRAHWRCDQPGCKVADWVGAVIAWPSRSAYQSNKRPGAASRSVYTPTGEALYPYMGAWAHGCEVTVKSGVVLIIEWKRGADVWREKRLEPGQTHVIELKAGEDGAMIETEERGPDFSVALQNCTPKPLPPSTAPH